MAQKHRHGRDRVAHQSIIAFLGLLCLLIDVIFIIAVIAIYN